MLTGYDYGANGNLCAKGPGIADATTSYKYNLQGLLAQVIEFGETEPSIEYRYDARESASTILWIAFATTIFFTSRGIIVASSDNNFRPTDTREPTRTATQQ